MTKLGPALVVAILGMSIAGGASGYAIRQACTAAESAEYFIPRGIVSPDRPDRDVFVREWYSKHLRVMGEPSLSCGPTSAVETYRLLWLRTFHRPVAVRVSRDGRDSRLGVVELTGAGGYEPGRIAARSERVLSEADWKDLSAALSKLSFWSMPTQAPKSASVGLDGAQWILEGRRGLADYHIVDRWSPWEGAYRDVGLMFISLAGISVDGKDLY